VIITIVTPSLDGMRFLPNCIESTRRQESDRVEVEHIIVDGGSTDGTVEYAASHGCKVMYREGGIYEALNVGSHAARGLLLGTLGCDDFLLPGALDAVAAHYERSGRRWIVGGCRWLNPRGHDIGTFRSPPEWMTAPMLASLGWGCVPTTSTYVHREFFAELRGFNPTFGIAGDYEFFVRALERERFSRLRQVLSCCYRHGTNTSMRLDDIHRAEIQSVAEHGAPASQLRRTSYRFLLRAWLNATNPWWSTMKIAHRMWLPRSPEASAEV
jgi:glycosyltransferase involved in cell wall biosynthesis